MKRFPWAELEIDPIADKREIKRAYARKLKQNRPDENPEGFTRLRRAYEAALSYADHQDGIAVSPVVEDIASEPVQMEQDDLVDAPYGDETLHEDASDDRHSEPGNEEAEEAQNHPLTVEQQELLRSFVERTTELLGDPAACNKADNWGFVEDHDHFFDGTFMSFLGLEILAHILAAEKEGRRKGRRGRRRGTRSSLSGNVLVKLDGAFGWRRHFNFYRNYFEPRPLHRLLGRLPDIHSENDFFDAYAAMYDGKGAASMDNSNDVEIRFASPNLRMLAGWIDSLFAGIIAFPLGALILPEWENAEELFLFSIWMLCLPLLEGTRFGSTPGKRLFGYKVYHKDGGAVTWQQLAIRMVSAYLFVGLFYLTTLFAGDESPLRGIGMLMFLVGGLLCYRITNGALPHDWISKTRVFKFEK